MKQRLPCRPRFETSINPALPRVGATLVEVLMSLLIMSIGIVSVFSLFPVAIVSSIRATQLTNGRILFDNVPELLNTIPTVLDPPLGPFWGQPSWNWKSTWRPNTNYGENDLVIPPPARGSLFPSPYAAFVCTSSGTARSGAQPPIWDVTKGTIADGNLRWKPVPIPNYVIDPFGFDRSQVSQKNVFGNRDAVGGADVRLFPRRNPIMSSPSIPVNSRLAISLLSSPDSWSVVMQEAPVFIDPDDRRNVTFPAGTTVDGMSSDPFLSRIIFTTPDGTRSVQRHLSVIGAGAEDVVLDQELPDTTFLGPARFESFSTRYTCMIAVRNNGADFAPTASCVVFFNRQSSAEVEHAYQANFGNPSYSSEDALRDENIGPDQVKVSWAGEPEPYLKEGGYLMDVRNLYFYRITGISKSGTSATLTLNNNIPYDGWTTNASGPGLAIMMPGILHVYEIKQ